MAKLTGRRDECDILDQFVDAVRGGASRALVVEGEAGVGKTALRESRRGEARDQLRTARELLDAMGMAGFAERARRELQATGETARKRVGPPADQQLTAQERQIAQLARDGMSNPEIGARLFISPRTVGYHLGNVFLKLGISSRNQLGLVLPADALTG